MKKQIGSRLGLAHVHDVLKQVCERVLSIEQACESLGVGKSRIYTLRSEYLKAQAEGQLQDWRPGVSGGNHAAPWDERMQSFLRAAIDGGYNYAFAASEVDRLYNVVLARSQVRRWAIREGICPPQRLLSRTDGRVHNQQLLSTLHPHRSTADKRQNARRIVRMRYEDVTCCGLLIWLSGTPVLPAVHAVKA